MQYMKMRDRRTKLRGRKMQDVTLTNIAKKWQIDTADAKLTVRDNYGQIVHRKTKRQLF